jgi:hypothetical protein
MAQIAIPLVIAGVLYLASNEKNNESFTSSQYEALVDDKTVLSKSNTNYDDYKNIISKQKYDTTNKKQKEDVTVLNNIDRTKLNTNGSGVYSQYQDKYMTPPTKTGEFMSLTGEKIENLNHNNMTVFYNNKSNGNYTQPNFNNLNENRLDTYTGMGTNTIEKSEISSLFKPQENTQLVYGSQNQSDFMQSRVNESMRKANTTPWEKVREAPGTTGFNSAVENRDKWMPKKVDDLFLIRILFKSISCSTKSIAGDGNPALILECINVKFTGVSSIIPNNLTDD